MSRLATLRAAADACDRRAARLADRVAADLMGEGAARAAVNDALDTLGQMHVQAGQIALKLRSVTAPARAASTPADYHDHRARRARLRLWPGVVAAARVCASGRDWPLVPPPPPRFDLWAATAAVMSQVFTRTHLAITPGPQADDAAGLGCFADIPLDAGRFLRNAHLAYRLTLARRQPGPIRFLDVGCGGGVKVVLAAELFAVADGLEVDAGYAAAARRTFAATRAGRSAVIHADALTFDGYSGYDVIYFFQPMADIGALHRLEARIAATARPGTVLIAPYHSFVARAPALGCTQIHESVFVQGLTAERAEALRSAIRRIGPDIADPERSIPAVAGWLRPLWMACLANGVRPDQPGGSAGR